MKKLLLVAAVAVAGVTGNVSAKGNVVKGSKTTKAVVAKCYNYVYDANGNVVGQVEVKCPDVVVPGA